MEIKRLLLAVLLLVPYFSFADSPMEDVVTAEKEKKHFFIATAETLLTNAFFLGLTGYVLNNPWAKVNGETIRESFTGPWMWEETDGFKVNQIGHPYQGGLYFNAGRANGFSFYESVFFSALGSFTWEIFCERVPVSVNDIITTTVGSASVGEMLHSFYLEAYAAGVPWPLALLISPLDGINRLVTRREPPNIGRNMYDFSVYAAVGYSQTASFEKAQDNKLFSFRGPMGGIGLEAVYGNPFEQHSNIPYRHFDLKMFLDTDVGNYFDMRIISDGYLLSFSPLYTETDQLSTGLTLHFDFVSLGRYSMYDSDIDQYSNALDWTVKYRRVLTDNLVMKLNLHGGCTFFGVSEYFSPYTQDQILKNYGAGTNIKFSFDMEHDTLGRLSFNIYQYYLQTIPGVSAVSSGRVLWLFADATYSHRISNHLSIGITDLFALERGYFNGFPGTEKYSNTIKTFIKWSL